MAEPSALGRLLLRSWDKTLVPDGKISWLATAFPAAARLIKEKNIKIVFASGGPFSSMVLGAMLKRRFGVKLVLDYRDPWSLPAMTMQRHNFFTLRLNRMAERQVLGIADKVIMVSDHMVQQYQTLFPGISKERFVTITNSYDESLKADYEKIRAPEKNDEVYKIVHAGNFYGNRTPQRFFEAMERIRRDKPTLGRRIRFICVGTNRIGQYQDEIRRRGLSEQVSFCDRVSLSEVLRFYKEADALLLINSYGKGNEVFIPQKAFDYLMTGKPILCLTQPGALYNLFADQPQAVIADPTDVSGIVKGLVALATDSLPKKSQLGSAQNIHGASVKTAQLAAVFESLSTGTSNAGTREKTESLKK
jgi:glycosyltransferase involved in cell wall biosynthesis